MTGVYIIVYDGGFNIAIFSSVFIRYDGGCLMMVVQTNIKNPLHHNCKMTVTNNDNLKLISKLLSSYIYIHRIHDDSCEHTKTSYVQIDDNSKPIDWGLIIV